MADTRQNLELAMCEKCKSGEICIDGLLDGEQAVGNEIAGDHPSINAVLKSYIANLSERGSVIPEENWMGLYDQITSSFRNHTDRGWLNTSGCEQADGLTVKLTGNSVGIVCAKCDVSMSTIHGVKGDLPKWLEAPDGMRVSWDGQDFSILELRELDDGKLGLPPIPDTAHGYVRAAKEFMKIALRPGPEVDGYESMVFNVAAQLTTLVIDHVNSDACDNVRRATPVSLEERVDLATRIGYVLIMCGGCGATLRRVDIE